mmetsp:Transcript_13128/g.18093  ORF Transcript_13128/g.18093 Transcript_13128/m.18093 type:complete len:303 (-) Transcript_13128:1886-2794(-)
MMSILESWTKDSDSNATGVCKLEKSEDPSKETKAQPRHSSADYRAFSNESSINGHILDFFNDDFLQESSASMGAQVLTPPPSSEPLPPITFSRNERCDCLGCNVTKEGSLQQKKDLIDQVPETKADKCTGPNKLEEPEMFALFKEPTLRQNSLDYMLFNNNSFHALAENNALLPKSASSMNIEFLPESPTKQPAPCTRSPKSIDCLPQDLDVLLGRGGMTNRHAGNVRFRKEAKKLKPQYACGSKVDKYHISVLLVNRVHSYGGRFLKRGETTEQWCEVGKAQARKKASQALREKKVRHLST